MKSKEKSIISNRIKDEIMQTAKGIQEELINIRRHLHSNPELSLKEFETSKYICEKLREYGIEEIYDNIYETAVLALIRGSKPGKTIMLRADMDALPIEELNDVSYKSINSCVMHACGHDSHVSWMIGAAIILNKFKSNLNGNVKILFQPAEEGVGGADTLLEHIDILNMEPKVDCAIAGHVWPSIDSGSVGIVNGCAMAAANKFTLEIIGKGGHGAEPQNTIDPIALANSAYMAIQQIVSRITNPFEPAVVTIGLFKGEGAYNVIPDKVIMEGTVRAESFNRVTEIMELISGVVKGIVEPRGGKYTLSSSKEIHSVINDEQMVLWAEKAIGEFKGKEKIQLLKHGAMTGEDFCYFSERVPSLFIYIGTKNIEKGINVALHNPKFNIDEDILWQSAADMSYLAYKYLEM